MTILIGVTGGSGSGKTTISRAIIERLGAENVAYLPHEAYYRSLAEMPIIAGEIVNFDHPDALDTARLTEDLKALLRGEAVHLPIYDFRTHRRTAETTPIEPKPVVLVEGILIFVDAVLRALCHVRVYVDTEADIRLVRRLRRDIEERGRSLDSVLYQYLESVRPMHEEFVEPCKRYAHLIIPEGGHNAVAIDVLVDHIRRRMQA